ncbi:MAG: molybdenum cofactor biosynthesis protein MoaE [Candidatus Eremiobacteraeota bacterium]|nr:molybdenum cofactor biosynthesis protein MoaE [Candidatus Eremiobacteraeota bacterium]
MNRFAVSEHPLHAAALENLVCDDGCGGLVTFSGVVRARSDDGRVVSGLTYEAHVELAIAEFEGIAREANARFGECAVAIHHRIGDLAVGETAVVVTVAAAHRAAAFDACRFAIDTLKECAPIWKREAFVDGTTEWRENRCADENSG